MPQLTSEGGKLAIFFLKPLCGGPTQSQPQGFWVPSDPGGEHAAAQVGLGSGGLDLEALQQSQGCPHPLPLRSYRKVPGLQTAPSLARLFQLPPPPKAESTLFLHAPGVFYPQILCGSCYGNQEPSCTVFPLQEGGRGWETDWVGCSS